MNYKQMKHPLTREQIEELTAIARELEQEDIQNIQSNGLIPEESKDAHLERALHYRQGCWRLLNTINDERK